MNFTGLGGAQTLTNVTESTQLDSNANVTSRIVTNDSLTFLNTTKVIKVLSTGGLDGALPTTTTKSETFIIPAGVDSVNGIVLNMSLRYDGNGVSKVNDGVYVCKDFLAALINKVEINVMNSTKQTLLGPEIVALNMINLGSNSSTTDYHLANFEGEDNSIAKIDWESHEHVNARRTIPFVPVGSLTLATKWTSDIYYGTATTLQREQSKMHIVPDINGTYHFSLNIPFMGASSRGISSQLNKSYMYNNQQANEMSVKVTYNACQPSSWDIDGGAVATVGTVEGVSADEPTRGAWGFIRFPTRWTPTTILHAKTMKMGSVEKGFANDNDIAGNMFSSESQVKPISNILPLASSEDVPDIEAITSFGAGNPRLAKWGDTGTTTVPLAMDSLGESCCGILIYAHFPIHTKDGKLLRRTRQGDTDGSSPFAGLAAVAPAAEPSMGIEAINTYTDGRAPHNIASGSWTRVIGTSPMGTVDHASIVTPARPGDDWGPSGGAVPQVYVNKTAGFSKNYVYDSSVAGFCDGWLEEATITIGDNVVTLTGTAMKNFLPQYGFMGGSKCPFYFFPLTADVFDTSAVSVFSSGSKQIELKVKNSYASFGGPFCSVGTDGGGRPTNIYLTNMSMKTITNTKTGSTIIV